MEKLIKIPVRKGKGVVVTPRITGKLKAIVINMITRGELIIESEEGYQIFKSRDMPMGIHYIPIKVRSWDNEGHLVNGVYTHFELNEKLIISFSGFMFRMNQEEQNLMLLLRYE